MGGKTKQSQRTKNNVRPSSSGRSALLLSNVTLETGVMKIAGAELPPLFPTLAAPIIDPLVSPELQMCIKKLNKKDPITKTKALQELLELVSNNKVDDIVAALPSWAHFYKMLTADPDRKVREVTQSCHGKIVSLCGRRIAPQLRALVPAWLQAQDDEHAPAQTHAQSSLAKTFPDSKLPEVVSFCKNEIVTHLVDNLTGTGEIIFIRKTDTPEEKEIQLIRILSSSLHGIQYTVQHLPREHDDWLWERVDGLLKANLFWKRATHSEIRIRAAWYAAVGSIIERYKNKFAEPYGQKTLRILIGAKEPSPLAAAQLWDSVLLFMYNVQEWHKYLDKPELLGKRILDVLENGGWGDARHLSNILLPLLAQLPPVMVTKEFFISFFNAIFVGLEKKTILSSKSERQTWITSLDECLRYLSIQSHEFVQGVVSSVHRTWLETILSDAHDGQIRTNLIKHSASNMATLVKYWLKQAKENNSEKYDQLIRNFWQNVGATVTAQVDKLSTDHADIAKLIDGHILLLQTLKTSFIQETKKQQCIKFDGDTPTAIEKPKEIQQCDASIVERYNHNLNDLVQKICGHYLEFASKKEISSPVLVPLITLLNDYDSESLFTGIARQFECDTTYKLYERVFRSWLAGDTMRCKEVLDIIFLFMKHLAETEQDALFDSFKQFPPSVVEWCISLSLSHPHCLVPSVRRWLRSTLVEATVCSICRRVVETGDSKAKSLLLMCLNHDTNGDIIVNESAVSKVLDQLSVGVGDVTSPALEVVATVGARLCTTLCAPGARLVLALFELSVRVPRGSEQLSLDTWCEVLAAWQDGLVSLPDSERADTLQQAAKLLQTHTRIDQKTVDLKQIEHVISLCPYLLSTNSEQDIPEIVEFSRVILDTAPVDVTTVLPYILRHTIVKGEMNCPFQDAHVTKFITEDYTRDFIKEMTRDNLISYLNNCTYRAMYLKTILLHKVDEDLDDTLCNDLLLDDYFKERFCDVLHDFLVICAMFDAYAFWPNYDIIKQTKHRLDSLIESMTLECTTKTKTHILNALSEIAATKGYYWAFARKWFENCTTSDNTNRVFCCEESDECYQANESIQDKVEGDQENIEVNEESRGKEDKKTIESSQETVESDKQDVERLDLEDLKSKVTGCGFFHNLQADAHWCSESPLRTKYLLMLRCFYAAHASEPGVIDYTFKAAQISCNPDVIIDAYYRHNHVMLCEMDITSAPWAQVVSNAAIVDYLATLVATRGWTMESQHWDFANITVCNLLSSVVKSKKRWGSTKMALFTRAVLKLFVEIQTFISTIKQECLKRQPSETVAHLPTEWTDVFAPDLNQNLFSLIMYILESSTKKSVSANHMAVLDGLILCTRLINWDLLPEPRRTGAFTLKALVKRGAAVLSDTVHHSFKYLAYELLLVMLKPVILDDASLLAAWSSEEEARDEGEDRPAPTFSLQLYDDAFFKLQDLVETAVAHINVCDATCELVEFTDVHVLALGWFLLVEVMGRQCRLARGDLQQHYIETYRENKYAVPLLTSALRLLPAEVFAYAQESDTPVNPRYAPMFTRLTPLNVYRECSGRTVSAAACRALYWCVVGAGAGETRGWRGAAAYKHARLLDNVVTAYISPQVVKDEFTLVQQKISEVEDTEVNILWAVYELTATLTLEDRPIDLRVMLSRSHPLGLPQLEAPEHGPASNCNWIIMYLGYQNGTLINALKMWTEAVTRKVERAPQCYICYCRLHFLTGRLPNTYCRTCRNKFHTPCLRKWLQTSTTPTCPLCRSHM